MTVGTDATAAGHDFPLDPFQVRAVTALERVVRGLPPEFAGVRAIAPLQLITA